MSIRRGDFDAYRAESTKLLTRGVLAGDIIEADVEPDNPSAIVWECQHTERKYVACCFSCIVDWEKGPRYLLVTFRKFRGPHLKVYLNDQNHEGPITKVTITHRGPKSAWCDVVKEDK